MAVKNVWARTLSLSSKESLQTEAEGSKNQMNKILANAKSFEEKRYVNEVYSAIESTLRNLATARNHFSLNVTELVERRKQHIADLEHLTTVSSDFASLIPRISSITFGTIGVVVAGETVQTAITGWSFLGDYLGMIFRGRTDVDTVLLPLLAIIGAGLGYLFHHLYFVPTREKKIGKQLIKTDYDKIMYYRFYLKRVQLALEKLYNTTDMLYQKIFNSGPYPGLEPAEKFVTDILESMDMKKLMCKYVGEHVKKDKLLTKRTKRTKDKKIDIESDTWLKCETGINDKECDHYK